MLQARRNVSSKVRTGNTWKKNLTEVASQISTVHVLRGLAASALRSQKRH